MLSGHIRALLAAGQVAEAEAAAEALPEALAKDPAIHRAIAAIALARSAPPAADYAGLAAEVAANPEDHESASRWPMRRWARATATARRTTSSISLRPIAAGTRMPRGSNSSLFEVVGMTDPWVSQQRRRLSAILFG